MHFAQKTTKYPRVFAYHSILGLHQATPPQHSVWKNAPDDNVNDVPYIQPPTPNSARITTTVASLHSNFTAQKIGLKSVCGTPTGAEL